jgi:hypothetical protein
VPVRRSRASTLGRLKGEGREVETRSVLCPEHRVSFVRNSAEDRRKRSAFGAPIECTPAATSGAESSTPQEESS